MSVHALHFLFLVFFPSRNTSNFFFYSLFITDCWPMTYLYLSSLKNFKCFIFIVWVFLLAHMSVYRGLLPKRPKEGVSPFGTGVTELWGPYMGARNPTGVLWKSRQCSSPLSHLFSSSAPSLLFFGNEYIYIWISFHVILWLLQFFISFSLLFMDVVFPQIFHRKILLYFITVLFLIPLCLFLYLIFSFFHGGGF